MRLAVGAAVIGVVRPVGRHVMRDACGTRWRWTLLDRKTTMHGAGVQLRWLDHTDGKPKR
jgi:hypothetical protein